jgi:AhpC/TSA family
MIAEGDKAPDFTLPDQDGREVSRADFAGRTLVLYFYPRADTPGCTTQACGIRAADYEAAGAAVVGVSPDPVDAIKKFPGGQSLNFTRHDAGVGAHVLEQLLLDDRRPAVPCRGVHRVVWPVRLCRIPARAGARAGPGVRWPRGVAERARQGDEQERGGEAQRHDEPADESAHAPM